MAIVKPQPGTNGTTPGTIEHAQAMAARPRDQFQQLEAMTKVLKQIKLDTGAMVKAMRVTSAQSAKEGLKERKAGIEKPGADKGGKGIDKKTLGSSLSSALKAVFGGIFSWGKWFAAIGLGIMFKDQIAGFLTGAFSPIAKWVSDWWTNDVLPALQKLDKALNPFSDDEGLFGGVIRIVGEWGTALKDKFDKMGIAFDNWTKDWFGFSIKDMILGSPVMQRVTTEDGMGGVDTREEAVRNEDGSIKREGGLAGMITGPAETMGNYFKGVGEGFKQFGVDVGVINDDGSLKIGGTLGLAALGATIMKIGPVKVFSGLFKGLAKITSGIAKAGFLAVKSPFILLNAAVTGLAGKFNKVKVPGVPTKTPTTRAPRGGPPVGPRGTAETLKSVKPGSIVTSAAGNKVLAGADGRPTVIRPDDAKGKAAIMKAADKAGTTKGVVPKPAAVPKPPPVPTAAAGGGGPPNRQNILNERAKIAKAISKYPRVQLAMKFAKRIPLLGSLISAGLIGVTLADDKLSMKEKTAKIAGSLGGIGGATMGGFLGALGGGLVGAAGGPLAVVSGVLGGLSGAVIGGLMGDSLFHGIAQFMLGDKVTAFPSIFNPFGPNYDVNALFNKETPASMDKPGAATPPLVSKAGEVVGKKGAPDPRKFRQPAGRQTGSQTSTLGGVAPTGEDDWEAPLDPVTMDKPAGVVSAAQKTKSKFYKDTKIPKHLLGRTKDRSKNYELLGKIFAGKASLSDPSKVASAIRLLKKGRKAKGGLTKYLESRIEQQKAKDAQFSDEMDIEFDSRTMGLARGFGDADYWTGEQREQKLKAKIAARKKADPNYGKIAAEGSITGRTAAQTATLDANAIQREIGNAATPAPLVPRGNPVAQEQPTQAPSNPLVIPTPAGLDKRSVTDRQFG